MSPSTSEPGIARLRKLWGWGYEDEGVPAAWRERLLPLLRELLPGAVPFPPPPGLSQYDLPPPRLAPPQGEGFPEILTSPYDRILHARGRSLYDLVELRLAQVQEYPDLVAYPRSEEEILRVLEWAFKEKVVVVPYGGGSSVTGGVSVHLPSGYSGILSLNLTRMNRILRVDEVSLLAEVEAGIFGPELDRLLKERGLTFRHFPQSYMFSTVGGWIATRSAGHYSTREGKIEERVRGLTLITPRGDLLSFPPFPGSSMGPEGMRLWIGSEGVLGIITRAYLELKPLPHYREVLGVRVPDFPTALEAIRATVQAGYLLSHLRALDGSETLIYRMMRGEPAGEGGAYLIVGEESSHEPARTRLEPVLRILRRYGGVVERQEGDREDPANWRSFFFMQPYLRDELVGAGYLVDTFETATTFSKAFELYTRVREATLKAMEERCSLGFLSCRTTHCYPTGVSLYFSFIAPSSPERMAEDCRFIKNAALEAVVSAGGTASHHHACGRDHRPWLGKELPPRWGELLQEWKSLLDPQGILNPGVLLPER